MIYIASDHGGFKLKENILNYLKSEGKELEDLGPFELNPDDDYPDFAKLAARKVSDEPDKNTAILCCRSGQGVNIVANKFPKVRSALVWNTKEAIASRTDDMVNVLSLPSDYISDQEARDIVKVWLDTPIGQVPRHERRVKKILDLETELKS